MTEVVALSAEMREELGTGPARALRRKGLVPVVVYGAGKKTLACSMVEKDLTRLYRKPNFISTIIELQIGEKKHKVLPKAVELHPITDLVRHVDFVFLDSKVQKMKMPIVFEGKERSVGVKRGGFFNIVKRTLNVACSVDNIPKNVVVDVNNMHIGHSLKASNITMPKGCQLLDKPDLIIASIIGRGGKSDAAATAEGAEAAAGK
jgi:large subunit ribosomal protein L25